MTEQTLVRAPRNLTITEEEFNHFYPDLVGHYDFFNEPPPPGIANADFERKYLRNKLWRLNNIYRVINKRGESVIFRMNKAQHKVYATARKHPRVIILKSRQQGISTFWLVSMFDDAVCCPYLNVGLMAQGTDEAATLLSRAKYLWDSLNPAIKAFFNVKLTTDNLKELGFSNKSTIFIRVSFRSATLQRLHISEYGKIANANPLRAKETKTGTLQALAKGNTGIIESTAEGNNDFKRMWNASVIAYETGQITDKDFAPVFLSWLEDPDCVEKQPQTDTKESIEYFERLAKEGIHVTAEQRYFWISQFRELGGDIYQEYPATPEEAFLASKDGTYYAAIFKANVVRRGKLRADVYDPNLPVHVFFDLGVDDYFVLAFTQWYRGEYRIIDEYWNQGKWLGHYIDEAFGRGYNIASLVFPHDIKVREQGAEGRRDAANSREEIVKEHMRKHKYIARVIALEKKHEADGIEAVRRMIPNLVVDTKCTYLVGCFLNFSKEWDEKNQMWRKTPQDSEWSHGADTLRGMAQGMLEHVSAHQSRLAIPDSAKQQRGTGFAV